LLVLLLNTN